MKLTSHLGVKAAGA